MGFGSTIPYYNLGEVKNSGIDASFTYNKAVNKDFTISLLGNIVYAHNKIIKDQYPEQIYSNLSHWSSYQFNIWFNRIRVIRYAGRNRSRTCAAIR